MSDEGLPLQFHPEVLSILGEELVSDAIIAISELVKNGYDADAEAVDVILHESPEQSIVVQDDGHGMTRDEIAKGWLVVGTPKKRERTKSRTKGRTYSGSMGIGRLAAFSIGDKLHVRSTDKEGFTHEFTLVLSNFKNLTTFEQVRIPVKTQETGDPEGTTIEITQLKWWPSEDEMKRVRRKLGALAGPAGTTDFQIFLTNEGERTRLSPEEDLPLPPLEISAEVRDDGSASVDISVNEPLYEGHKELPDEGWHSTTSDDYASIPGATLTARWYPVGDRPAANYWKVTSPEIIKEAAGVKVYRDDIRVLPYGEPGNDWLNLEKTYVDRGSRSRHPRPHQVVGWIAIEREKHPGLGDTANREGMRDSQALRQLRAFGREVFEKVAEIRRIIEPVRPKDKTPTQESLPQVKEILTDLKSKVEEGTEEAEEITELEGFVKGVEKQSEVTALYRDRLTAGNLVNMVMHDLGVNLKPSIKLIDKALQNDCEQPTHQDTLEIMEDMVPRLLGAYNLLRGAARAGAYRVSSVRIDDVVEPLVEKVRLVEGTSQLNLELECESVTARLREADIWAIVSNLLMNAITSSEYDHGRDVDYPTQREVLLEIRSKGDDLVITCDDNGPGLPDRPDDWIWAPFNSTRKGGGSGLGLYIISDAVTWYGGTYTAANTSRFPTGASFKIELPDVISGGAG